MDSAHDPLCCGFGASLETDEALFVREQGWFCVGIIVGGVESQSPDGAVLGSQDGACAGACEEAVDPGVEVEAHGEGGALRTSESFLSAQDAAIIAKVEAALTGCLQRVAPCLMSVDEFGGGFVFASFKMCLAVVDLRGRAVPEGARLEGSWHDFPVRGCETETGVGGGLTQGLSPWVCLAASAVTEDALAFNGDFHSGGGEVVVSAELGGWSLCRAVDEDADTIGVESFKSHGGVSLGRWEVSGA